MASSDKPEAVRLGDCDGTRVRAEHGEDQDPGDVTLDGVEADDWHARSYSAAKVRTSRVVQVRHSGQEPIVYIEA